MGKGLINDARAWLSKEDPDNPGAALQLLRVFLDSIEGTLKPAGLTTGRITKISLTETWVKAERGPGTIPSQGTAAPLDGRSSILIQNINTTGVVLFNYEDPSAESDPTVGAQIAPNGGFKAVLFNSESQDVWIRMLSGTGDAIIDEVAP